LEKAVTNGKLNNTTQVFTKKEALATGSREGRVICARAEPIRDLLATPCQIISK